ncbi:MAG: DUF502 domain-containing protein [Alphaproteobacteria bacterium]
MSDTRDNEAEPKLPPIIVPVKSGPVTRLRNWFLTGIVVTAPIAITIYLAWVFVAWVDDTITPLIPHKYNPETYLPFSVPGLGLVVVVIFLTFIGFITANLFGRTILAFGERLVNQMPIVRTVYSALKQILETVLKSSSRSFKDVVLVQYPREGIWALAFVTANTEGELTRRLPDELVSIFIPTTPNPTSGFLLFVPRKDCIFLDMSVEEAAKLIISAGVITPPDPAAAAANDTGPIAAGGKGR